MALFFDLLGYLAVAFIAASAITKKQQPFRVYNLVATILFGCSVYYYEGVSGSLVAIFSALLQIVFILSKVEQRKKYSVLTPIFAVVVFFLSGEGTRAILPALASFFSFNSVLSEHPMKSRALMMVSAFMWLAYGIILGSLPAILYDVVAIVIFAYNIYDMYKNPETTKPS